MTSISNRDWLMRLAHDAYNAQDELATWMGAEHGTNGNADGTNGIHASAPLADGDAVAILRDWLDYKINRFDAEANAIILNTGADPDKLYEIADMVERDYVSREAYDYAHREFNRMNEERREAFAERDKWKAKCERQSEAIGEWELRCERLESECEEYEDLVDALTQQIGELKAKAKAKSAKRAAAVERLRDYERWSDGVDDTSLTKAVIGAESWGCTWQENRDALIDLLTDESWEGITPETPDSVEIPQKTGEHGQEDDGLDTREKLEADVHQYSNPGSDKSTIGALWEKKMLGFLDRQKAITEHEARAQLDADWPKLLRCLESDYGIAASWDGQRKIWLTERAGGSATDAVREFAARYEQRIEELERLWHSFENEVAAQSVEIAERDKRIAELEDELHRSYDAESAKAEELTLRGVRIAELEAELAQVRGNLKNATHNYAIAKAKCESREQAALRRERKADEKMAEAERAIAEPPDERVRELIAKLESERDGWRMRCGELLDAAHAIHGVADAWDEEVR